MRASVRSPAKGQNLLDLYSSYGSKLQLCIVDQDIAQEGSFDDAVKGVEGIIHTASPVHLNADDPSERIVPAVQGVTSLLKSAFKHGTALQRVVFTSSCAAIRHYPAVPITLFEADWNDEAEVRVSSLGRAAEPQDKYSASKTMAEKALWEFSKKHKADLNWDMTALNPPYIFGPVTAEPVSAAAPRHPQATSSKTWFDAVVKWGLRGLQSVGRTGPCVGRREGCRGGARSGAGEVRGGREEDRGCRWELCVAGFSGRGEYIDPESVVGPHERVVAGRGAAWGAGAPKDHV